jgi:hypothetical protein
MKTLLAVVLVLASVAGAAQESVVVAQVNDRRTSGSFAQLAITVEMPKIASNDVAASRVLITKAVDETGRDLLDPEASEPDFTPNHRLSARGDAPPSPASVYINLENPDRKAMKVQEIRGEIELFMPGKDPNSVAEIAKFLPQSGKPLAHKALKANGVEIVMITPAQVEADRNKRAEAKKKEYAEMGFEGEDLANMLKGFLEGLLMGSGENDLVVRIKDPNKRIQQINYIDGAGEVQQVSMLDDEGTIKLSTWAGKPQPDWKLRVSMKTPKNVVRYPFVLKDVPLP